MEKDGETLIAGYDNLAAFLTANGFPIRRGSLNKYCSGAVNTGPEHEGYWGQRKLYRPSKALEWARSRIRRDPLPNKRWDDRKPASPSPPLASEAAR